MAILNKHLLLGLLTLVLISILYLYHLGSLVPGLGPHEIIISTAPVGWHGIWANPLYLPIKIIRSLVYMVTGYPDTFATRLPSAVFGVLSVISFAWLIWLWHGPRTAVMSGILFATSAWTLHVSRYGGNEVLYLWALPALLLGQILLYRYGKRSFVWYGNLMLWGLALYIPGLVWLLIVIFYTQRKLLANIWRQLLTKSQKIISVLLTLTLLPLLIKGLFTTASLKEWLGWPAGFDGILAFVKHFLGVFVHIFIRGPKYPEIWLERMPLMDVFAMLVLLIGIYFYVKNRQATRSRIIGSLCATSILLVALNSSLNFSLLVSLAYVVAAAGLAYLLHEWMQVFPLNPLARSIGIGLISLAIILSAVYNLRAYFIAWPHNSTTQAVFHSPR